MSRVNNIQQKILELSGGEFEKLFDAYLYKKYDFSNIQTLGVQAGTNKTTKGTPDSYVLTEDGKYILITCGSVGRNIESKLENDIKACFDKAKLNIEECKIQRIICGHTSNNLSINFQEKIKSEFQNVIIDFIGIDTISHDLAFKYQSIVKEYLNISIDSNQLFDIDDFIAVSDKTKISAPLDCNFLFRENELEKIKESIKSNVATVIVGPSGIGKTRIALEVCKSFEKEGYNVICIKSNGNLLYDDIECQIEQEGKYLLLFDDANLASSFEGVISYILNLNENYEVRVLITVRDYAKRQVAETLYKFTKPNIVTIDRFDDNNIQGIIEKNFGIINKEFLNRISEMSGGNIRIAIFAAINIKNGVNDSLNSIEDILKNYYATIIKEAKLSKDKLILLCAIELIGRVQTKNNELYKQIVSQEIRESNISELINDLYESELIDQFENEVVSISDQVFGDYILYYVLCYKKWLSLSSIIKEYFPKYKYRIVYVINTLLSKFHSKEITTFVSEQIKNAWDESKENDELYVETFHNIDPIKSLSLLKGRIDNSKSIKHEVTQDYIEEKRNYEIIKSKEVEILSDYKYLECFEEAFELLLKYFEKRPDLFMDFYFAIKRNLLYDKDSYYYKYEKESSVLSKLWGKCKDGEEYNYSLLYINVVEFALNIVYDYSRQSINNNSITIYRVSIVLTDEMKKMRAEMWKNLFILREHKKFTDKINSILTKQYFDGIDENSLKDIVKFDFDCIYQYLPEKIDYISANIIDIYKRSANHIGVEIDNRLLRSEENEFFRVYKILHKEYDPTKSMEENNEKQKSAIYTKIRDYDADAFNKLFKACKYILANDAEKIYDLENGMLIIFQLFNQNQEKFSMILKELLKNNIRLRLYTIESIVQLSLNVMGFDNTRIMLCNYESDLQKDWLFCMWEMLPYADVTKKIAKEFTGFLKKSCGRYIPSVFALYKYYKYDSELTDYLINACADSNTACESLLKTCDDDDEIKKLLKIFQGKELDLYRIYIKTFGLHVDIHGKLFMILYKLYPDIWDQYVDYLKDVKDSTYYKASNIIERMWTIPEYSERMQYAFDTLLEQTGLYHKELILTLIGKKNDGKSEKKKKEWLLCELKNSSNDLNRFNKLINSVAVAYPEWEIEYILEFIRINKSIDDFKKIDMFPLIRSWSGSEIPLINSEIKFLEELRDRISGLDYIEHKKYLNERIECRSKWKHEVEIKEYLNNIL